ncbi:hypothetical protein IAD21_03147 [Abditibacteriota bacterium]|nr:hypothetical protein IAD21_03147 [Abditibacteriota bacterium]
MNASPLASSRASSESSPETSTVSAPARARRRSLRSLLGTITGICFVFGALAAVQVRSISNMQKTREDKTKSDALQSQMAVKYRLAAQKNAIERDKARKDLTNALNELKGRGELSQSQISTLTAQIKSLQVQACLTPMVGEGVRIVLSDNPQAASSGGNPSLPLPGLVHDYDVLQVVNELRAAKADAIGVHGAGGKVIRITGGTPIRCVGPVIFIDWKPVAAPFTIEAVGDAKTLQSAIEMPGGIVENLRVQGAVGVKVTTPDSVELPAADSALGSPSASNIKTTLPEAPANTKGL